MMHFAREHDIEYAPGLKLDLVRPDPSPQPAPVIIWLHDGGWRVGDRSMAPDLEKHFAAAGFVMISIDYRLSGEATFPAQLHDVRAAVRWARAHGPEYSFQAGRIGLWGSSAGGHLAALVGVLSDQSELAGEDSDGISSSVDAVVVGYAPIDLTTPDQSNVRTEALLGGPVIDRGELALLASPNRLVGPGAPPFLIVHGDDDELVSPLQSRLLYGALAANEAEVALCLVEGFGHGFFNPSTMQAPPGLALDFGRLERESGARAELRVKSPGKREVVSSQAVSFEFIGEFFRRELGASIDGD